MDPQKQLAQRLRAAREAAGMSQQDVADRLSIRRPAISEIENGKRAVIAQELAQMARLYGMSTDALLQLT